VAVLGFRNNEMTTLYFNRFVHCIGLVVLTQKRSGGSTFHSE